MAYLLMPETELADLSSGIISLWVKCSVSQGEKETISKDWLPKPITELLGEKGKVAFPGASYAMEMNGYGNIIMPPHIWCYPFPGPAGFIGTSSEPTSWKDGIVPLITFGDPKQKYDRIEWKLKELLGIWIFGNGGVPQMLTSQYPEEKGKEEGIVPPSCIGVKDGKLRVILQTNVKGKYKGCAWAQSKSKEQRIMRPISCQHAGDHPCSEPEGWEDPATEIPIEPNQMMGWNIFYEDVSMLECAQHPEAFIMDSDVMIADGKWHHVLLSFDLKGDAPDALSFGSKVPQNGGAATPKAAGVGVTPFEDVPPPVVADKVRPEPARNEGGGASVIYVEATGPENDRPALPGPWGQYSGRDGEYALAPFGCLLDCQGSGRECTYAELACYGRPFETVGKYGKADGGKITCKSRGWLAIDDKSLTGKQLNHKDAWAACEAAPGGKAALDSMDKHAIMPPNAFLIPGTEIRYEQMTTNGTAWEREYRTVLGGYNGPAAKMPEGGEPRQLDYVRPSYEFGGGSIPIKGHAIAIPGGPNDLWGKDRNYSVILADLQIWPGCKLDLDLQENRRFFIDECGEPVSPGVAAEKIGKPIIMLHWATNWLKGKNTGTSGYKATGAGAGTDPKNFENEKAQFTKTGNVSRSLPDPDITPDA